MVFWVDILKMWYIIICLSIFRLNLSLRVFDTMIYNWENKYLNIQNFFVDNTQTEFLNYKYSKN